MAVKVTKRTFLEGGLAFTVANLTNFSPFKSAFAQASMEDRVIAAAKAAGNAQDVTGIMWAPYLKPMQPVIADFKKAKGIDVEYVMYTNEDVPRKVLAALTAGSPPDLSYGFLFDLQHTARWAADGVLDLCEIGPGVNKVANDGVWIQDPAGEAPPAPTPVPMKTQGELF